MCVCYLHDIESALCLYDNYITFSQDNVALRVQVQFSAQAVTHSTSSTLVLFLLFFVRRSNFLYDVETDTLNLIDFGAVQAYPHDFCYNYARFPPKPRH